MDINLLVARHDFSPGKDNGKYVYLVRVIVLL
jgi:hypothetical protein